MQRWAANDTALVQRRAHVKAAAIAGARLPATQPGPQTDFYESTADIVVYGGAAGGGKTFGLLVDFARPEFISNKGYGFVIFRRTSPEITNEGGLWDESSNLYHAIGGKPRAGDHSWRFPSGAKGRFAHLVNEEDKRNWQGTQLTRIGFDELPHFTESQFFYLVSRNRSLCGIRPQVRATCNPHPGWVKKFLSPWVDKQFPHPAASGEVRWFVRQLGKIVWVEESYRVPLDELGIDIAELDDDAIEAMRKPKSVTFIRSDIFNNPALIKANPDYLGTLRSLPPVEQARLLYGDWDVFEGAFFDEWSETAHTMVPPCRQPGKPGPLGVLPHWWSFYGGMDWGYSDKSAFAFLLMAEDEHGTTHVIEEIHVNKMLDDDLAVLVVALLTKWGVPISIPIACDTQMWAPTRTSTGRYDGPAIIEAFWKAGLRGCATADKDRIAGWSQVRRFLAKKDHFKVWRGYCEHLIEQFPLQQYAKPPHDLNDMDTDGDDHLHDALRYALNSRPRPAGNDPMLPPPPKVRKEIDWTPGKRPWDKVRKGRAG